MPLLDGKGQKIGVLGCYTEITNFSNLTEILTSHQQVVDNLTQKQKECLIYLCKGMTAKHIAYAMDISERTVEFHMKQLKDKLRCLNKSALIAKALSFEFIRAQIIK